MTQSEGGAHTDSPTPRRAVCVPRHTPTAASALPTPRPHPPRCCKQQPPHWRRATMTDPVSRTILLLDIERFSDRDDVEQAYLRRMLYDITDRTLECAGIDETRRLRADRGDSVIELIDANAPVTALLRALLMDVPAQLRVVNRMASSSAQIRLRGVVATGYVAVDEHDGWIGTDLNDACRLLDAQLLRAALRERPDDFALIVSDALYTGGVRHDHPG